MSCHVEVDNASSIVNEYDEDEQDFEPNGVHREEVDRSELRNMIIQEGPPRLGGRFPTSDHVLGHRGFGNLDAQLCAARKFPLPDAPSPVLCDAVSALPRTALRKSVFVFPRLLNQASNAAVKTKGSIFDLVYRRLVPRLGHAQAIGAISNRMCRLIWMILHQGIRYEERGPAVTRSRAQRRTAKMIRELRKLGYCVELRQTLSEI